MMFKNGGYLFIPNNFEHMIIFQFFLRAPPQNILQKNKIYEKVGFDLILHIVLIFAFEGKKDTVKSKLSL